MSSDNSSEGVGGNRIRRRGRGLPPPAPRPVAVARVVDSSLTPWLVYKRGFPTDPFDNNNVDAGAEEEEIAGCDSENDDDRTNVVDPGSALNVREAGTLLSDLGAPHPRYPRYRLRDLHVDFGPPNDDDGSMTAAQEEFAVLHYRRTFESGLNDFVIALDSYVRIRSLTLTHGNFRDIDDDDDLDEGSADAARFGRVGVRGGARDVDRLFKTVLSGHLSLRELTISRSRIGTSHWRLFTDNLFLKHPSLSFDRLVLREIPFHTEHCQLLRQMLRRRVRVDQLEISECGLDAEQWRVVAEGVQHNTNLHALALMENRVATVVGPTTLLPLLQKPSVLNRLDVQAPFWADGAFEAFVTALKTNDVLSHLTLRCRHALPHMTVMEEVLTTYNFTLQTFTLEPVFDGALHLRIGQLLVRNLTVRNLSQPHRGTSLERYRVSVLAAWPDVLHTYGRFPTLLYRFLRHANLDALVRSVTPLASSTASEGTGDDGPAGGCADDELGFNPKKRRRPELTSG